MADWALYYTDLTKYTSDDGAWRDAPADNAAWLFIRNALIGRKGFDSLNHLAYFFWPAGGDTHPIGIAHCVPTLTRMGYVSGSTMPRPFPETNPKPWLQGNNVLRFFKLIPHDLTEQQRNDVLNYAISEGDIPPGWNATRRSGD
jgi:hypothetical protein